MRNMKATIWENPGGNGALQQNWRKFDSILLTTNEQSKRRNTAVEARVFILIENCMELS